MQNFNTLFGYLFLALVIAYMVTCAYVYYRLYKSVRRQQLNKNLKLRNNLEKIAVPVVTITTLFILIRWSTEQFLDGCTNPFFWNLTCYNISEFNHLWNSIVLVLGINAVLFAYIADVHRQDRESGKWKK